MISIEESVTMPPQMSQILLHLESQSELVDTWTGEVVEESGNLGSRAYTCLQSHQFKLNVIYILRNPIQ